MKVDKNSKDITKKYQKIRSVLKSWCKDKGISWSKIQRYLERESNYKKFIVHNNLEDTHSTKKIIFDTLEDFLISESLEWDSMFEHEKMLADYFDVSLSHIKLLEPKLNLFTVDSLGQEFNVILLSKEDQEILQDKVWEHFSRKTSNLNVEISVRPDDCNISIGESSEGISNSRFLINQQNLRELFVRELKKHPKNLVEWQLFLEGHSRIHNILDTKVVGDSIISKVR
jgi:hypothetical protein